MTHLASRPQARRVAVPRTPAEQLLDVLGVDPAVTEAVFGDFTEEYARRSAADGVGAARRWYAREVVRSAPYLVRSWIRHMRRHAPRRLAAIVATVIVAPFAVAFLRSLLDGPPARLVAVGGRNGVVVNSQRAVRLPLQVLDVAGHVLQPAGVRYEWVSGAPAAVFADGSMVCAGRGDAVIRASLGPLSTDVTVLCRPVHSVMVSDQDMAFVAGDPARDIAFSAVDKDRREVSPLTGILRVRDTTIASVVTTPNGHVVEPRAPGRTTIDARIGDVRTTAQVTVYTPVPTLEGLGPEQRFVAAPVRLASGETRRWRLAPGDVAVSVLPGGDPQRAPRLAVIGATCLPGGWRTSAGFYCVAGPDAWVVAYRPWQATPEPPATSYVLLERP